ncbi:chaperonin 10-like protein [Pavlovales sp. CCMP2436]|nr:chaperonin 10-like protein [Pavlovales sp. CCMP2436]
MDSKKSAAVAVAVALGSLALVRRFRRTAISEELTLRPLTNARWTLARHPDGAVRASDFELVEEAVDPSALPDGHVLVRVTLLSIDAFIRTTLDERAYHGANGVGSTVTAIGLGVVVASASASFKAGDAVAGLLGAQSLASMPAAMIQRVVRLPGLTADAALVEVDIAMLPTACYPPPTAHCLLPALLPAA